MRKNSQVKLIVMILLLSQFIMIPVYSQTPDSVQGPTPIWSDQTGNRDVLVQCSGDGKYVVSGSDTGILRMYDQTGKILWTFKREGQMVRSIAISGNGDYVGAVFLTRDVPSYYTGGEILFFNRTGGILWDYSRDYTVERIAISDDGNSIYASGSPNLYSFDRNGTLIAKNESGGRTWVLTVARDGAYAVAGGTIIEKTHIAGSPANGIYLNLFEKDGTIPWNFSSRQNINSIGISPDAGTIVSAARYNLYSFTRNGTLIWQLNRDPDITSVAVSEGGNYTVAGSQFYARLFNRTGSLVWQYKYDGFVQDVGISDDEKHIIAGMSRGVYVFSQEGKVLWNYPTPKAILHVSMANDGGYFAAGTADTVYFFNMQGDRTVPVETESPTPNSSSVLKNTSLPGQPTTPRSPLPTGSVIAAVSFIAFVVLLNRRDG